MRDFSHALLSLMDKMVQSCLERNIPDANQLLCVQFIECVYDGNLSRVLRRIACEHPNYDLHDLRDDAIKWDREGRLWECKTRSHSVRSAYSMQHTGHRRSKDECLGPELAEFKELLKHQQAHSEVKVKSMPLASVICS